MVALYKFLYILTLFICINFGANAAVELNLIKKKTTIIQKIKVDTSSVLKKNFETNYKQKYQGQDFVYEKKSKAKNAWDRFVEWLSDWFASIFRATDNPVTNKVIEYVIKFIAFGLVIFVIYLIVKSILNKEGQWIFGKNSDKKTILYGDVEKNIQSVDFKKLIESTLKSGENRLCIRYYYLWLLKQLSEKEIIEWDVEKTNSDYYYEIQSKDLQTEFSYLSYLYNNIWYGEVDLDQTTFEKAKIAFEKTIKTLQS